METGPQIKNFFDDGSPFLDDPFLTPERTVAEIDRLAELVGSVSGRVLDVGCGFGRHSIELAARFADVTGIDRSATMIDAARASAIDAGQFVDFINIDAAEFREIARYDLAVCLFNAFGQQTNARHDDRPHTALLDRVHKAMRPGGTLVLEVYDKERFVPALVDVEHRDATKITRFFDKRESTITERYREASGPIYRLFYRVFDRTEIADLLHDAGFEVQQVLDRGLAADAQTHLTVIATRPS